MPEKELYKDPSQPISKRVEDLIGKMTLEEKVAQLGGFMPAKLFGKDGLSPERLQKKLSKGLGEIALFGLIGDFTPKETASYCNEIQKFLVEKTRLGIPMIRHEEAISGLLMNGATSFPQAIALAATWEPQLIEDMTTIIRKQMRIIGAQQALSPVMDICQDPRWGRIGETYGEDPYLCSAMAMAFVKGLQGDDLKEGVIATGKHFLGYGVTQGGLNTAATHVGKRELYEVFARPFEAAIRESNLASIMNSYSEIDGIPCGASREVLTDLLRGKMGFTGFVVSDYWTIPRFVHTFQIAPNEKIAGVQALKSGIDIELPNMKCYGRNLEAAVKEGLVSEETINDSVRRVLEAKFKLGLFENPFVDLEKIIDVYEAPENREHAQLLARKSITLLKNEKNLLPLKKNLKSIAVIGPNADSVRNMFGNYTNASGNELMWLLIKDPEGGPPMETLGAEGDGMVSGNAMATIVRSLSDLLRAPSLDEYLRRKFPVKTVLESIKEMVSEKTVVNYAKGCEIVDDSRDGIDLAVKAAKKSEVAVLVLGGKDGITRGCTSGEGRDVTRLCLPKIQQELLEAVHKTGTPIVLILINTRPFSMPWAAENVPAIIEAWVPGQEGGPAIIDALFGEYNPGGKLPVTIARNVGQVPIYYYHKAGSSYIGLKSLNRKGYVDETYNPLFPFGHGLSYTEFKYENLSFGKKKVDIQGAVEIALDLQNVGQFAGEEVVQLYFHDREAEVTRPVKELVGFKRVQLKPNERCRIVFKVKMNQLGFYDRKMNFIVEPGKMDVMVGSSSEDIRLTGEFEIIGEILNVKGNRSFKSEVLIE